MQKLHCLSPFCFRKERREQGLTVVVDSRRQQPAPALLSSMSELQVSQARKICNYPPTHTHRGFSGPAKSPLSSEPSNSMFLPVYYTVAFLAPFLLFDQPALLTQIGFFSKGSPFEFAVSAALRHVPEKRAGLGARVEKPVLTCLFLTTHWKRA